MYFSIQFGEDILPLIYLDTESLGVSSKQNDVVKALIKHLQEMYERFDFCILNSWLNIYNKTVG